MRTLNALCLVLSQVLPGLFQRGSLMQAALRRFGVKAGAKIIPDPLNLLDIATILDSSCLSSSLTNFFASQYLAIWTGSLIAPTIRIVQKLFVGYCRCCQRLRHVSTSEERRTLLLYLDPQNCDLYATLAHDLYLVNLVIFE